MGTEDGGLRGPAVSGVREIGGAIVVELAGELDLHNSEEVRSALERAAGSPLVVVDLSAVEFVDSTVIGAFVEARKRAGSTGFHLAAAPAQVRRALTVAGVDSYLELFETLDAALAR